MWNSSDLEAEMSRRAECFLPQTHLIVDYYRIRRKIALPLPVCEMTLPDMPVRGISEYPWSIWAAWALEERIHALGWHAQWTGDEAAIAAARRDLIALAHWPAWRQLAKPDLCLGHTARTLAEANRGWAWLGDDVRAAIHAGLTRMLADGLPLVRERFATYHSAADILACDKPAEVLHNIPLIGTIGLALVARTLEDSAAEFLADRVAMVLQAILDYRRTGFSEGVAYNGYVMDFAADWLFGLPEAERAVILEHPAYDEFFAESLYLAAPGAITNVAELGDVEPREMSFHISHHAKRARLQSPPNPLVEWYLQACPLADLRADALAALHDLPANTPPATRPPTPGALDAHYATVLRSGWTTADVAVAVAASTSTMGHIHHDNGSIVIGTRGEWLITDPGYQQYMPTTERDYTLGVHAHNAPVINGFSQVHKTPRDIVRETIAAAVHRTRITLTGCYPESLGLERVRRTVWLAGRELVVIADEVNGADVATVAHHWHGLAGAAWGIEDGWATLIDPTSGARLCVTSPQTNLAWRNLDRQAGSRGTLALGVTQTATAPVIWWVFVVSGEKMPVQLSDDRQRLGVADRQFTCD